MRTSNLAQNLTIPSFDLINKLKSLLDEGELDQLKYRISLSGLKYLENGYDLPTDPNKRKELDLILSSLLNIQSYAHKIPKYGIAYLGRPKFMTDKLLRNLIEESESFRDRSRPNFNQMMYQPEEDYETHAEKLAHSEELKQLVEDHVGKVRSTFTNSYIYYIKPGQSSPPHVDNLFTSVTAMVGIKHTDKKYRYNSCSFSYWPGEAKRYDYRLKPGEISIFYGVAFMHGRTPVVEGEEVYSLLTSFRPV